MSFLQEYLSFTKKERWGIFSVLLCIVLCIIAPFFYPYFIHHKVYNHSDLDSDIAMLKIKADTSSNKKFYANNFDDEPGSHRDNYRQTFNKDFYKPVKSEVFYFDPNTATADEWKRLGIRDKTAETIQKYLSKGGHFYKPEDISKIWGLHEDDIKRLLPYVKIEGQKKEYAKSDYPDVKKNFIENKSLSKTIDVNAADTAALIALPGIGSKLAQRIISFRDKLGGFYSVEQVGQTFGLADSTFQKIKPKLAVSSASVKQLNINTASLDEMKSHPYIRYNLANAIIQYRAQHGNFSSVIDLKNIMLVNDDVFNKVAPYLIIEK